MTEQYKIGDRFVFNNNRANYTVQQVHGKDVVLVFAGVHVSGLDYIFVVESCYNPECDYTEMVTRVGLGEHNYELIPFDKVVPVVTSKAPTITSISADDSLGLVTITLRLDKELVDKYKVIAYDNRMLMEVLMRNCLEGMSNLFGRK